MKLNKLDMETIISGQKMLIEANKTFGFSPDLTTEVKEVIDKETTRLKEFLKNLTDLAEQYDSKPRSSMELLHISENREIITVEKPNKEGLRPYDYRVAIEIQDAGNISGIARNLFEVSARIRNSAGKELDKFDTSIVNNHPIIKMHVYRMAALIGLPYPENTYNIAKGVCQDYGHSVAEHTLRMDINK